MHPRRSPPLRSVTKSARGPPKAVGPVGGQPRKRLRRKEPSIERRARSRRSRRASRRKSVPGSSLRHRLGRKRRRNSRSPLRARRGGPRRNGPAPGRPRSRRSRRGTPGGVRAARTCPFRRRRRAPEPWGGDPKPDGRRDGKTDAQERGDARVVRRRPQRRRATEGEAAGDEGPAAAPLGLVERRAHVVGLPPPIVVDALGKPDPRKLNRRVAQPRRTRARAARYTTLLWSVPPNSGWGCANTAPPPRAGRVLPEPSRRPAGPGKRIVSMRSVSPARTLVHWRNSPFIVFFPPLAAVLRRRPSRNQTA